MKTEVPSSPAKDSDDANHSLPESYQTVSVPHAKAGFWRQWMAFSGPAILISVGSGLLISMASERCTEFARMPQ